VILITTGISGAPFDRLLEVVERLETDEPVVVQHGPSQIRPSGALCVAFLTFEELSEHVARASKVVTHAGAGSVLLALAHGKRPIVTPRLKAFAEAVDDHQLTFGRHLAGAGLVTLSEDPADIPVHVSETDLPIRSNGDGSALAQELSNYLTSRVAARSRP
jgi:UDP-N-acetylglucosamine transferase subunit ALG13